MRRRARRLGGSRRLVACGAVAWGALAALVLCGQGCTNAPFDPDTLPNQPPVARIFATSALGDTLNATSYYRRTFHWSGSDADGRVEAYFVSIETLRGVPAPWDTTTRTDTTMTFTTDDFGHAEATVRLACRDDRGALSDTVAQYFPLRNFPPVVNFQADFDTVRWSYAAANFRFFALDLDGNETMDDSLTYWLDTADTTVVRAAGEPGADPVLCRVRKPFDDPEAWTFSIALVGMPPAARRTLTVAVRDEARAEARQRHSWKVLEARGPVLLVADSGPSTYTGFYAPAMNALFGADGWSLYNVSSPLGDDPERPELSEPGLPDQPWVLRDTFRQFPVVLWFTGGAASLNLKWAVTAGGANTALGDYLVPPEPEIAPGRFLLVSKSATGSVATNVLPPGFVTNVLGISTTAAPASAVNVPIGRQALGQRVTLPAFASNDSFNRQALGVVPRTGTETIYKLEYYQYDLRPPYEPIVGVRRPALSPTTPLASVVLLSLQLESFDPAQATAALGAVLRHELGVAVP